MLFARSDWFNRRERFLNFRPLFTLRITFWSVNYSACALVYTKTIIHLSVGESDGWLSTSFVIEQSDKVGFGFTTTGSDENRSINRESGKLLDTKLGQKSCLNAH